MPKSGGESPPVVSVGVRPIMTRRFRLERAAAPARGGIAVASAAPITDGRPVAGAKDRRSDDFFSTGTLGVRGRAAIAHGLVHGRVCTSPSTPVLTIKGSGGRVKGVISADEAVSFIAVCPIATANAV